MKADQEMDRLIAAYLDGTLGEKDRASFEQRIRDSPEALQHAADAVRFDMQLADAARPDHLELVQQRRVVIDRASGRPVVIESTQRVEVPGASINQPSRPKHKPRRWLLALPIVLAMFGTGIWLAVKARHDTGTAPATWVELPLKNPGFELPDLGSVHAKSETLDAWQDKFTTPNALLEAAPPGGVHGGKQVALLEAGGHIKQLLFDKKGETVTFEPGTRIRVSGWVKPVQPLSTRADVLNAALHFVDDRNRQYVVAYRVEPLDGGGWRHFSIELPMPAQETFEPSYPSDPSDLATVRGRQILLSVTNISAQMPVRIGFMLDDLKVESRSAESSDGR